MRVRDVILRPPVTIPCDATVHTAAQLMARQGVGALIVTDGDVPVGIVTDRDLVVRSLARGAPADGRVDAVMSGGLTALDADADVRDAVKTFGSVPIRRLPVVEGRHVVGMITVDDLLIALTAQLDEVTRGLLGQVMFPHAGDEAAPPVVAG